MRDLLRRVGGVDRNGHTLRRQNGEVGVPGRDAAPLRSSAIRAMDTIDAHELADGGPCGQYGERHGDGARILNGKDRERRNALLMCAPCSLLSGAHDSVDGGIVQLG